MHYGHPITRHDPPITVKCSGTCGRDIEVEAWEDPTLKRTCASCVADQHAERTGRRILVTHDDAPLPSSDALLVLSEDGETVDVIDPAYVAPSPLSLGAQRCLQARRSAPVRTYDVGTPTNAQRGEQRAHERRTRTLGAPTPSATSLVIGPLVALVGWVAIILCAYVGYRLTHSGEVASVVGFPLARLRRVRPATDEGAWYYAVALQGAFEDCPSKEGGEWEFDSLEEAMSHARKLRLDWGEDEVVCVHPYRRT